MLSFAALPRPVVADLDAYWLLLSRLDDTFFEEDSSVSFMTPDQEDGGRYRWNHDELVDCHQCVAYQELVISAVDSDKS